MKCRGLALMIVGIMVVTFLGTDLPAKENPAQTPRKAPPAKASLSPAKLPNMAAKKWTGDLDGMIKRRRIRALVPLTKTFYFIDRGIPEGIGV